MAATSSTATSRQKDARESAEFAFARHIQAAMGELWVEDVRPLVSTQDEDDGQISTSVSALIYLGVNRRLIPGNILQVGFHCKQKNLLTKESEEWITLPMDVIEEEDNYMLYTMELFFKWYSKDRQGNITWQRNMEYEGVFRVVSMVGTSISAYWHQRNMYQNVQLTEETMATARQRLNECLVLFPPHVDWDTTKSS
ncbi:hypothetical protein Pelo_2220 [Pelomyxa schiedti]|nr:hypothetical protein Pelo_2220 [Pelomyxa schiedti]